jgi:O6-methylguanine-DNA--protein-cysteine methyltransferase
MGITEAGKGVDGVALPQTSKQRAIAVLREQAPDPLVMEPSPQLELAQAQLLDYLAGKRMTFDVPLDLSRGTAFQRQVWRTLLKVPFGKLRSYQ